MPYCPNCGSLIPEGSTFCPKCGQRIGGPPSVSPVIVESKNPGIAALLAGLLGFFGLWGIGHIYVGRIGRGIALLVVGIILALIVWFALAPMLIFGAVIGFLSPGIGIGLIGLALLIALVDFAVWIWQIFDAYNLAKKFNEYLQQNGKPPW